jgi:GPH family glycoside/pentoside/hexuronide:cation symporter
VAGARIDVDIPKRNRIIYASASFGGNLVSRTSQLWLLFYYAPPSDADLPTLAPRIALGIALIIIGIEDAIDDALIGFWSDRTRTRWGRRLPFIVFATPFYLLFFFLLFQPPGADYSDTANLAFFVVIVLAQRVMGTLSGGPLEALLPEISRSSAARVSIVTWQVFLGSLGAAVALIGSGLMKDAWGFTAMAAIIAVLGLASRYTAVWGVWNYARRDVPPVRISLRESIRTAFGNDQFRAFLPTFVLFQMAVSMLLATMPFFAESVILGDDESRTLRLFGWSFDIEAGGVTSVLATAAIVSVIVSLPVVFRLSGLWGKARVYSASMLLGATVFPLLFFMAMIPGIDPLWQSLVLVPAAGCAMTGVFAFPNAIMADIIDYDELRTGERREAFFFGAQNTLEKWAGSFDALIIAAVLLAGETADNPLGIRLVGPVAGIASAIAYFSFRGYRLPDEVTPETVTGVGAVGRRG